MDTSLRTDATGTYNFLTDALGSTVALTNSAGSNIEQYSYGPYGMSSATGSNSNSFTYTGRESDGLGIDYYRARYYSPATGRFLSEDPTSFGGGINIYVYAMNNPVNLADPFGTDTSSVGVGGGISLNGYGVSISGGFVGDGLGNLGWYWSYGGGVGVGLGWSGSLGVNGTLSDGLNISDFGGPFGNFSGTLGDGLGATGDLFWGNSDDGFVEGEGLTIGLAGGASASTSFTETFVHPFGNPFRPNGSGGGNGHGGSGNGGGGSGNGNGCSMAAKKC